MLQYIDDFFVILFMLFVVDNTLFWLFHFLNGFLHVPKTLLFN